MDKKVSMKDIAQRVGVSIALVSYVLNDKEGRVSPEMAQQIRAVAEELNYRPNLIARSLQSGRTNTLGLIVADISNPFFSHIARIIEDEAKQYGYTVLFGSSDESVEKSQGLIDTFLNRQVDALILAPAAGTEMQIRSLKKKKIPFVLIDRYFPEMSANCVRIDNFRAAYKAVSHLVRAGKKRIALLTYTGGMEHMQERERGYRQALEDHGVNCKKEWLLRASYQDLEAEVALALQQLLTPVKKADALFFATNSLAIEGLKQLNRLKLQVPDDVAVISFDESDAFDLFYAPVSYVRQSLQDMGKEAVRLAMGGITQKTRAQVDVIVGADLVVRESCGFKAMNV